MNAKEIAVAGATGRLGRHLVDVLEERGHEVVRISRTDGVDLVSGEGLEGALAGVEVVVDAASYPLPDEREAGEFFTTAVGNLQRLGEAAGVRRLIVVSIIGTDRFKGGYGAAKIVHERVAQEGPIPARIVRAAQFHEFVPQVVEWSRQDDLVRIPIMRTQVVAARTVAETVADVATSDSEGADIVEIAGPREERFAELARLYLAAQEDPARVEEASDSEDPNRELNENGGLLPGPGAILAGPTFEEWLEQEAERG
jgi:uncharacterized protein YbjT (DUF2867 family)